MRRDQHGQSTRVAGGAHRGRNSRRWWVALPAGSWPSSSAAVDGAPVWTQVPVQVDQRKVVAFGTKPSSNATAGVVGTVYGNGSGGPTALQYADPNTFVGADTDPNLDADDEVVFMAFDGGGERRAPIAASPPG